MKTITKFLLLTILILMVSSATFGQQIYNPEEPRPGTPDYLLVKKGFSIFRLGDPIYKHIKHFALNNYYDNDGSISVYKSIDPEHLPSEDGIKIKYMELRVNKGLIESIDIFVSKQYKDALLNTLKTNYGYTKGKEAAFWKSNDTKIVLSYTSGYRSTDVGRAMFVYTALDEIIGGDKIVTKSN